MLSGYWLRWKNRDFYSSIPKRWVDFFRTNPTDEQISILDSIDDQKTIIWLCIVLIYTGFGVAIGLFLGKYPL